LQQNVIFGTQNGITKDNALFVDLSVYL